MEKERSCCAAGSCDDVICQHDFKLYCLSLMCWIGWPYLIKDLILRGGMGCLVLL